MRKRRALAIGITMGIIGVSAWRLTSRPSAPDPPAPSAAVELDPAVSQLISKVLDAARQSPRDAEARLRLAMAYHANGLADSAEQAYQQSLALDDDNARAWHSLARVQADLGDVNAALASMDRSIAIDPAHSSSHWRRGFWLLDEGDVSGAEQAFRRAMAVDGNDPAAHVGLARAMIDSGRYEEAVRQLEGLLRRQPPPPNVSYVRQLLGTAYQRLGKVSGAQSALAGIGGVEAIWPDPWASDLSAMRAGYSVNIERAAGLLAAGRTPDAMQVINDILRGRPNDVTALNYLAQAYMAQGKPNDAIDSLRKALLAEPDHGGSLVNCSLAFEQIEKPDQALAYAHRAVQMHPTLGAAHLQLGRLLALTGDLNGAVSSLTNAMQLGVSDWQTRLMLGNFLLEQRNWSEADRVLEQTVAAAPDSAPSQVALARARMELGQTTEAKSLLDRARQLDPGERSIAEAQRRLEQLQSGAAPPATRP